MLKYLIDRFRKHGFLVNSALTLGVLLVYLFVVRPSRVYLSGVLCNDCYMPFGMWYFGVLCCFLWLSKLSKVSLKTFCLRLTLIDLILFGLFQLINPNLETPIAINQMASVHMLMSIAILFSYISKNDLSNDSQFNTRD